MLFFLDYEDHMAGGARFTNSPGLLPLIEYSRRQGFQIDFISTEGELLAAAMEPDVDVLGISSMERLLPRSIPLARQIREQRPDLPMILGGNSIETFALELAGSLFDVVVLGEGDHLMPALLRAFARAWGRPCVDPEAEADLRLDAGVEKVAPADPEGALDEACIRELMNAKFVRRYQNSGTAAIGLSNVLIRDSGNGTVWELQRPETELAVDTNPTPLREELDDFYVVPWEMMEEQGWNNLEFYAQRGCRWGQCTFCSVGDRNIRAISAGKAVEVITEAARRGVKVVSFADNLFVQEPEWNHEVLDALAVHDVQVGLRAQTMAVRTCWPLLGKMRAAGFFELAFGLETLLPERAVFMAKSFNGKAYVRQARETVARASEAGIYPVLYMIMTDPKSTLVQIAEELELVVGFLAESYRRTHVVPKPSYTLLMLPVAGTQLTEHLGYHTAAHTMGDRDLMMPENFNYQVDVSAYLNLIGKKTLDLARPRENMAAFPLYFDALCEVAGEAGSADLGKIEEHAQRAMACYEELVVELDRDVDATATAFASALRRGQVDMQVIDYRRFGPYISGIERLNQRVSQILDDIEHALASEGQSWAAA